MDEFIIINKTALLNRLKKLKEYPETNKCQVYELEKILSQSTPLIPVVEESFGVGRKLTRDGFEEEDFQDYEEYISNLKLDI